MIIVYPFPGDVVCQLFDSSPKFLVSSVANAEIAKEACQKYRNIKVNNNISHLPLFL